METDFLSDAQFKTLVMRMLNDLRTSTKISIKMEIENKRTSQK